MSWLFSQVLVGEYLGDTYLDGEQFVQLNGKNTQQAYCAPDKMTKFSRLSRYGMMFKPLTEEAGMELLMSFQAGFRAKIFQPLEKELELGGGRSGMWKHMARIVCEVEPRYVYVENSPMLTSRGIDTVLKDLATIGYDAEWGVFSAAQVGAPHLRKRIWIVAKRGEFFSHTKHNRDGWWKQQQKSIEKTNGVANSRCKYGESWNTTRMDCKTQIRSSSAIQFESSSKGQIPDTNSTQCKRVQFTKRKQPKYANSSNSCWWAAEPNVGRVANGMADRVDRLKTIGNGQVPLCAAIAFELLQKRIT